ncbi:MAG: WbqC family protein, partial [Bacteroidia bacterium]|nr:WbqC family protein [Bacteroidia bacterium]
MQPVLLPLAYWGTIEYWKILLSTSSVYIEVNEHLPKQTIRTFCQILNANGVQKLSIPVNNSKQKAIVKNVTIENTQRWQHQHWQSLVSSYKSAPYFEHYEPYIKPLYITPYLTLSDFNLATTYCILKILKQEKELMFTPHYENSFLSGIDLR